MTPNVVNHELDVKSSKEVPVKSEEEDQIIWANVVFFIYLHCGALLGLYYCFTVAAWKTILWIYILLVISTQATGAGAHRLWTHRAYKAKLPLKLYLAMFQTMTYQKDIYNWCRDHRMHHKFSDTEGDPHNASRGFLYSHMGWLMLRKSDTLKSKLHHIDLSDLEADPIVMFQRKYYIPLSILLALVFPAVVPWYFWNENLIVSWYVSTVLRYCLSLHGTCLVNSAAHIFGTRPYDKNIKPTENLIVAHLTNGEGFHNYHHAFPYDYRAAELGSYNGNWNTLFIDLMYKIGWAYDLKKVPDKFIRRRIQKTGDGSWTLQEQKTWGWGDENMDKEEAEIVQFTSL